MVEIAHPLHDGFWKEVGMGPRFYRMHVSDIEGFKECRQLMHLVVRHGIDGRHDSPIYLDLTLWADETIGLLNPSESF